MNTHKFLIIMASAIIAIHPQAQPASQGDDSSFTGRLIQYNVKPAQLATFQKAVREYVLHSLTLDENIMSEAYYEQENTAVLWIIERWNSTQAADKASVSRQFKAITSLGENALITPAKTFYVKDLEQLSKAAWRTAPGKDDTPLTIMLFVDSKAGTAEQFKQVYHTAMPQFRSEAGVINYQLSQLQGDSTQFVTYEKFRNEAAFQYHLSFPPIQPVIDYLNTSIKTQPFQAGLHRLVPLSFNNKAIVIKSPLKIIQ